MLVLGVVGEHHPPAGGCETRVTCHVSRVTCEQSPVVCGRLDVDPVPVEAAVAVGGEGAAGPHAHRVHVVPGEAQHINMCLHEVIQAPVGPVGGEPAETELANGDHQLPTSCAKHSAVPNFPVYLRPPEQVPLSYATAQAVCGTTSHRAGFSSL